MNTGSEIRDGIERLIKHIRRMSSLTDDQLRTENSKFE